MLDNDGKRIVELPPKKVIFSLIRYSILVKVMTRSWWRSLTFRRWKEKYMILFIFRRNATSNNWKRKDL